MEKAKIAGIINDFLVEELEIEEELTPTAKLKDELGIESLDFVDIAVVIEKEFGFKVNGEEMTNVTTLGDLHNYIFDHLNKPK